MTPLPPLPQGEGRGEGVSVSVSGAGVPLEAVERAAEAIRGVAVETPAIASEALTQAAGLGAPVVLKLESLQVTGSFKIRGAYNKLARGLSPEARARGVIAASAGNHGQGVALSARLLGVPATVVMPEDAAYTKVKAIRGHGAEVVLHGAAYEDAYRRALALAEERGLTLVHPFDDPDVVAGQGTIGLEVLRAVPDVGTIVVPIGGGGLISGIACAAKALRPDVRVVGVVAEAARGTLLSFERRERVDSPPGEDSIADGIRVKRPGEVTFPVILEKVDQVVDVTENEIGDAIYALLEAHRIVAEGAGAVAVAALLARKVALAGERARGRPVVAIVSGGNIDLNLLTHVIERGLTNAGKYLALVTRVPDRPGQLFKLLNFLKERKVNVLEIEHHRAGVRNPLGWTGIELIVETKDPEHGREVFDDLKAAGYEIRPLG